LLLSGPADVLLGHLALGFLLSLRVEFPYTWEKRGKAVFFDSCPDKDR
jgi:hypothetical protein